MILVGDLASPTIETTKVIIEFSEKYNDYFKNDISIVNLEGLLTEKDDLLNVPNSKLFNHPSVLEFLNSFNTKAVALANNHVYDLPNNFDKTITEINNVGIEELGIYNKNGNYKPYTTIVNKNTRYYIFNACWEYMHKNKGIIRQSNHLVNPISKRIVKEVKFLREKDQFSHILVYLHWGFDLEHLPLPMDRDLARQLVDAGADLVVGAHPHRIQGGEKYKKGYIVYSLGNFFIPHNIFSNGNLSYPSFCNESLILKWTEEKALYCAWLFYDYDNGSHNMSMSEFELFSDSSKMGSYSPFFQMPPHRYTKYYKNNRSIGKRTYPVFKSYNDVNLNKLYYNYLNFLNRHLAKYLYK